MKKIICLILSFAIIACFCSCKSNTEDDYSSSVVIYQEEIIGGDDVSNENSQTQNNDVTTQTGSSKQPASPNSNPTNSNGSAQSSTSASEDEGIFEFNNAQVLSQIKTNGRCSAVSNGIELDFVGSAIEFNADCTAVDVHIDAVSDVYFSIYVDGKLTQERVVISSGSNALTLARNLSAGVHNFKLVRETEAGTGRKVVVTKIQLGGGNSSLSSKPQNKSILIEFLGDSLSSGYGNLTTGNNNAGDAKYQNGLKAYPYLVADKLGADYRIVSRSGIGLKYGHESLPTFPEFYAAENYFESSSIKYSSSNPADVNVVIVNLGTNDYDKGYEASAYEQYYADLINNIGYSKNAKIVLMAGGGWEKRYNASFEGAKAKLNALGYSNVYTYTSECYTSGGASHPSADEHTKIADSLVNFLKQNSIA